jgi:hypothetical protein
MQSLRPRGIDMGSPTREGCTVSRVAFPISQLVKTTHPAGAWSRVAFSRSEAGDGLSCKQERIG